VGVAALTPRMEEAIGSLRGKRLLVKLGGEVMLNSAGLDSLASQLALLSRRGVGVVLAHGGGPQADALAASLGHNVRKVAGRRVTDSDALEVAKMVYAGSINVDILAVLKRHGARAVGLSGVDADLLTVSRRPPVLVSNNDTGAQEWVDYGHVGDIVSVDVSVVELLLAAGYIPVIASLAADRDGSVFNINADTAAAAVASALGVYRLVLVTNVAGIMRDPSDPATLLPRCTPTQIRALVADGTISGGMLPKVHNCLEALKAGVRSVQILDGTPDHPLLLESLVSGNTGTTIVSEE
jgi:acetylglutamate kinase